MARAIINRAERQLLQERVRSINTILLDNGGRTATSRSRFSLVTTSTIQLYCNEFINKVRESRFILVRDRQVNKFNRLANKINSRDKINNSAQSTSSGNQAQDTYSTNNGDNQSQSGNSTNN